MRDDVPLIELLGVEVRRARRRVLGPLSLALRTGETLGVVGPNGAGKSTLLAALAGAAAGAQGEIRYAGRAMAAGGRTARRAGRGWAGVLLQHHDAAADLPLTVREVVLFGRLGSGMKTFGFTAADRAAAGDALAATGMTTLGDRLYRELSGGERRKAQLARLLAGDAPVLLLDEPGAGLDLEWQERLTRRVETIAREGRRTVVMVTHDVGRLPASCSRVVLLQAGRVLADGAPEETLRAEVLSRLYGCPMEVVRRTGRFHAFSTGAPKETAS